MKYCGGFLVLCTHMLGCGAASAVGPVPPGLEPRYYASMQTGASAALDCPREQLEYTLVDNWFHRFSGCGQMVEYRLMETENLCAALGGAPRDWCWITTPRPQAAFDMNCPIDSLTVRLLSPRQNGVEGCNARIRYVFTRSGWVADTASTSAN